MSGYPTGAVAEEPPGGRSPTSFPAWWARPGAPGWTPDAALAGGQPWVFAGLANGGFDLRDPLTPAALPYPGVAEAQAQLAWYDSAEVVVGQGAAWHGFGAPVVSAEPVLVELRRREAHTVWTVVNGDKSIDRNAISFARGDRRSWVRAATVSSRRAAVGDLGSAGNHMWNVLLGGRRGAHALEASFSQRGSAESQLVGAEDASKGQSGYGKWEWSDSTSMVMLRYSRGRDERESFATGDALYLYGRREAQANMAEAEARTTRGVAEYAVRLEARESHVERRFGTSPDRTRWAERALWAAARASRPLGPGRLELQLGGGHDDAPENSKERVQLVPGVAWRVTSGARMLRLFAERTVNPVWSDLAPGTPAFMQDTWTGGAEAHAAGSHARAGVLVLAGSTGARAALLRYPIRDAALRVGWEREADQYEFALSSAEAAASWKWLGGDASGFLLARRGDVVQNRVDPAVGGTAGVTATFRMFAKDLGVRLRGGAEWIGPRDTDTRDPIFGDVSLPGYTSLSASVEFTLGDATIRLLADGLENERHDQTWLDLSEAPNVRLAKTAGRIGRFELVWPLFN